MTEVTDAQLSIWQQQEAKIAIQRIGIEREVLATQRGAEMEQIFHDRAESLLRFDPHLHCMASLLITTLYCLTARTGKSTRASRQTATTR